MPPTKESWSFVFPAFRRLSIYSFSFQGNLADVQITKMNNIMNGTVVQMFWRTRRATLHHGGKDFALDSSSLLDLGFAILLVLLNKVFSVPPRKT